MVPEISVSIHDSSTALPASTDSISIAASASFSTPTPSTCGNGILEPTEGCDDGNTFNNDGCSSTCTVEAYWTCSSQEGATSVCSMLVIPKWTGLSVLSGTNYAGMTNELAVLVSSNFPLRIGSNFSIVGLNVSIDGNSQFVSVSGKDISPQAVWTASEGRLTLFVTSNVNAVSFTVKVQNPSYSRDPILLGAECFGCVSFAPSYIVYNGSLGSGLATTLLPPSTCGKNADGVALYGSSCQYTCYGVVSGEFCVCMSGQFGPGCSQTLGAPTQSLTMTVSPDQETSIQGSGGLSVSLPAGALASSQPISVSVYNVSNLDLSKGSSQTLVAAGPVIVFSPAGLKFNKYITINIPYEPSRITAGLEPYVFYYNAMAADPWERQISTAKPTASPPVLEAQINHFSGFVPLGAPPPPTTTTTTTPATTSPPSSPPGSVVIGQSTSPTAQSPSSSPADSASTPVPDSSGGGSSVVAIAAGVAGAAGAAVLVCCLLWLLRKRKTRRVDNDAEELLIRPYPGDARQPSHVIVPISDEAQQEEHPFERKEEGDSTSDSRQAW
ncbi:hypothetical protein GUITHDRAFT_145287 [Guillardia theta CCMP2712]|uniref:ZU5 domain-containing protein n=1 Tax=Guillardia theta (strain CCMP2712) TaxID=905079 RepID=L1ILN7_GUITC|nr:hypothetical protein GUITHDRAFT_145287 [Guillardia theta CCMP2712]EKX37042.1 hypothetical protein GUITHDRAFT_145287 [Guillardia theta CCMP2712]|eukprot:XP_005824022.1 hypothetical protein GUITHDRAFT_145287 [Guillardia theta CCMP2712]